MGAGVLVSMPSGTKVTSTDAAIDNRSTRLVRAFAPRPANGCNNLGKAFVIAKIEIYNDASSEGYDANGAIVAVLE
jgi:hypothetical protein